jgi:hypothetical protein
MYTHSSDSSLRTPCFVQFPAPSRTNRIELIPESDPQFIRWAS